MARDESCWRRAAWVARRRSPADLGGTVPQPHGRRSVPAAPTAVIGPPPAKSGFRIFRSIEMMLVMRLLDERVAPDAFEQLIPW
jgi:hypothetical protein